MDLKDTEFFSNGIPSYVLIGNVNTGKSTIFNFLCKKDVHEGNYPGTSVFISYGNVKIDDEQCLILDTPGSNTIFGENEDERISKKIISNSPESKIIFIADAKNLKRSLALFFHYAEFGIPVIFNINMIDEAHIRNIDINVEKLEKLLNVKINTSVAIEGDGIESLKKKFNEASLLESKIEYPDYIESYLKLASQILCSNNISRGVLLSALAGDDIFYSHLIEKSCPNTFSQIERLINETRAKSLKNIQLLLIDKYLEKAEDIYNQTVWESDQKEVPFADKLGILSRNISTGIPIAIFIIFLMYLFVGKFGAEFLVGLIEGNLFGDIIIPYTEKLCRYVPYEFFSRAIVGEYGLLSVGLSLAIGVVMPVLLTFYFFFGLLENSGYLPRLGILLNNIFKKIGLSGKGVLPMIMGFSCITMAILTTRVLDTNKEKTIATFLLVQGIPCAPLLSVMFVLLSDMALWCYFFIFFVITIKLFITGYLVDKIFKGRQPDFIMEIPILRIPKLKGLVINSLRRTYHFLQEAIPVFLFATFIVFILDEIGGISFIENLTEPLLSGFVGLPKESVNVFLMSFIRREAGVALLTELVDKGIFNQIQIVINLLLISFLIPCINAIIVMVKERGAKVTTGICGFVLIYAILLGAILNYFLLSLNNIGII